MLERTRPVSDEQCGWSEAQLALVAALIAHVLPDRGPIATSPAMSVRRSMAPAMAGVSPTCRRIAWHGHRDWRRSTR
jgi:hypothetical protein